MSGGKVGFKDFIEELRKKWKSDETNACEVCAENIVNEILDDVSKKLVGCAEDFPFPHVHCRLKYAFANRWLLECEKCPEKKYCDWYREKFGGLRGD